MSFPKDDNELDTASGRGVHPAARGRFRCLATAAPRSSRMSRSTARINAKLEGEHL